MNIYSIIGFILATFVFIFGLKLSSNNLAVFLDYPSLFIVLGGTIASTALSFQLNRMWVLLKVFVNRVVFGKRIDYQKTIEEIIQIAEKYRRGENLESLAKTTNDPFFKDCLELAHEGLLSPDELRDTFLDRAEKMTYHYLEEAKKIKTICKYPPAFGMLGTTIGMIVLLANLNGADAIKMIGPAMGICLVTTLYGCALANLFMIPIADNLIDNAKEIYLKNQIISDGTCFILERMSPILVSVKLNNYLLPSERINWKKALGK